MESRRRDRGPMWSLSIAGCCTVAAGMLTGGCTASPNRVPAVQPTSAASPAVKAPLPPPAVTTPPTPPVSPAGEAALRQGLNALQQHRLSDAASAFEQAVRSDPRSPLTHDYLGIANLQRRRFPEALRQFQEETRLDPNSGDAWARVADVHYAQHDPVGAIRALERAVALSPNQAQLYFNLGTLYPQTMEMGKAVDALNRCVALEPENPNFQYTLGNLLFKLTRLDESERAFKEAVRLAPNVGAYHFGVAEVLMKREATPTNTEAGQQELERALSLGMPGAAESHYQLGQCYERQEKWDQARRELEISVKMAPEAWAAYYALQEVATHQGRTAEARQAMARFRVLRARADAMRQREFYFQEAQRNPDSPEANFQLGVYLAGVGERAQSREALERARRLAGHSAELAGLRRRIEALTAKLGAMRSEQRK